MPAPSAQDRDQMSQFAVDIFGPGDGVGDLGAQQFAESLPEPMHRHLYGSFCQIQLMADLRVGSRCFIAPNENFQRSEEWSLVGSGVFASQYGEHLLDQSHCPLSLEVVGWVGFVDRLASIALLSRVGVKGKKSQSATTFETARPFPFVDQKVFQRSQQERAELAAVAICHGEVVFLQQAGKEGLRQILSIFWAVSLPSDVNIKRIPVSATKFLQSVGDIGRIGL